MSADRVARLRGWYRGLDRSTRIAVVVLAALYAIALLAPLIAPHDPSHQADIVAMKDQAPSLTHLFGTDRFSRDVLSRVMYGMRVSLAVATLSVLVAAVIGTFYGLVAAMGGPVLDSIMMRLLDAMLSIPRVLLLIAVLAFWSPLPLAMLIVILGTTGWFEVSRLVRAEALTIRERDFVLAARSLGAGRARIMLRHLLPNVLGPVIVTTTLNVANVIVLEAGLSFIGIGAREPAASLGTMLQDATEAFAGTWWTALVPGAVIVIVVLCVNILGDALRVALDPRQLPSVRLGTRTAALTPATMATE